MRADGAETSRSVEMAAEHGDGQLGANGADAQQQLKQPLLLPARQSQRAASASSRTWVKMCSAASAPSAGSAVKVVTEMATSLTHAAAFHDGLVRRFLQQDVREGERSFSADCSGCADRTEGSFQTSQPLTRLDNEPVAFCSRQRMFWGYPALIVFLGWAAPGCPVRAWKV